MKLIIHHSLAQTYVRLFRTFPNAKKLGVTATPWRLNHEPFTSLYQDIIVSPPIKEFIRRKYLADYVYVSIKPDSHMQKLIDQTDIALTGDFDERMLEWRFNQSQIRAKLLEAYKKYADGKKGIIYAINKEHANRIARLYNDNGYNAVEIDCDTPKVLREYYISQFKEGKISILVNVQIFTEGFDCPDIEFIQLARPTRSLALYLQQVGRGLRYVEGKENAIILDNVGLYNYFGLPDANRKWRHHFLGDSDFEDRQLIQHRSSYTWFSSYERDYSELNEEMIVVKRSGAISEDNNEDEKRPPQEHAYNIIDFPNCVRQYTVYKFVEYLKTLNISGRNNPLAQEDYVYFIQNDSDAESFWLASEAMSIFNPKLIVSRIISINYSECDSNIFNPRYRSVFRSVLKNFLKSDDKVSNVIQFVEVFSAFEDEYVYDALLPFIHNFSRPEYFYHFWSLKKDISIIEAIETIKDRLTISGAFALIEAFTNDVIQAKYSWDKPKNVSYKPLINNVVSEIPGLKNIFIQSLMSKILKGRYSNNLLNQMVNENGFAGFHQYVMKTQQKELVQQTVSNLHSFIGQSIQVRIISHLDNHYYVSPTSQNKMTGIMGLLPYTFAKRNDYKKGDLLNVKVSQYNRAKKIVLVKEIAANIDIYSIPLYKTGARFKLKFSQNRTDRKYYPSYDGVNSHFDFNIINYSVCWDKKKKYIVEVIGQQNFFRYIVKVISEDTNSDS